MGPSWESVFWIALLGLVVGHLVERAIVRLALGKSLIWPIGRYCPRCYQPLPAIMGIPLLGYFWRLGRCHQCDTRQSLRRVGIPLLTASLFLGLLWLYFGPAGKTPFPSNPWYYDRAKLWLLFSYHAILISMLILATFTDLDWMIIPDSITVPGMLLGIGLGTFGGVELHPVLAWSPPPHAAELFSARSWADWMGTEPGGVPRYEATRVVLESYWVAHWPIYFGLLNSILGFLAGGGVVWIIRALCSWVFGKEAMGFGDVTLMAMVGSFVGWQTVIIAFFLAPVSALVVGVLGFLLGGRLELPFGPHLSLATVFCLFFWKPIWRRAFPLFSSEFSLLLIVGVGMLVLLVIVAGALQWTKRLWNRLRRS
ncbi:Type 4 prepilin-like proteins leader peptide-processing enzyme [Planctomycetes bacterium Pan216]|uniref:Type 4 prepilin-like proteins leader peptide-processing enzyme n=1 Tax=Kolteria novifilia TaxID=2527975 RepID=A0A518BBY6_9BACT|nr:Type 4 prepilin-like proteins leader peptide-processing enzyme [Planctomycetes bacterium Pan216]